MTSAPLTTLPAKRRAVVHAAVNVFVREGYAGTSVDVIAAEAGVSKQTIYNYYGGKESLFLSVIEVVLEPVAAKFLAAVDETLSDTEDLAAGLARVGRAWCELLSNPDLAALRRLIIGEATRYPQLLRAWQGAGPERTIPKLIGHFRRLTERGVLTAAHPERAARQFTSLMISEVQSSSLFGSAPLPPERIDEIVTAGVQVWLRAYSARDETLKPQVNAL